MSLPAWFARNTVAANLLMGLIVCGGLFGVAAVRKQSMPDFAPLAIQVSIVYPGAAPEDVETALCARLEERVRGLESVRRVRSIATEGRCAVTVELLHGADMDRALDRVKARVDTIDSFPAEAERPVVRKVELRQEILSLALSGPADERTLRTLAERLRNEILALDEVTQAELVATRAPELSIEVSEQALRRHGLTLDEVAAAVRRSSLDLPGGVLYTRQHEILLRTDAQAESASALAQLVLLTRADGTRLQLGDVATVRDGFAEVERRARLDGEPAVLIRVFRVGEQQETVVSRRVNAYVDEVRPQLPEGLRLTVWQDDARMLRERFKTLLDNGRDGLVLVFLALALFLRARLAFWVTAGIPISFLGTLAVLPFLDVSLNMMSLLGFLIVLGVVVDDAVVVGESVHRQVQGGRSGEEAAVGGVRQVAMPVVFAALTTMAAFAPLTTLPGAGGDATRLIPIVVIATLVFSLVESLLILPAHLRHLPAPQPATGDDAASPTPHLWARLHNRVTRLLERFVDEVYLPLLRRALVWRYTTAATALFLLLLTLGFTGGGYIAFSFFPPVEGDHIAVFLTLPLGTPAETTIRALTKLEASAQLLKEQLAEEGAPEVIRHVMTTLGDQPYRARQSLAVAQLPADATGAHLGEVALELAPAKERRITAEELARRWRQLTDEIPDAEELRFDFNFLSAAGEAINIELTGNRLEELRRGAAELEAELAGYPGVVDIRNSFRIGKEEVRIALTPEAENLGLTLSDLARQVRQAFYGEEVHRLQRGSDEVRVMVRYPAAGRRSRSDLDNLGIRTPTGGAIPFSVAGKMLPGRGPAAIERVDGKRSLNVLADVDQALANSNEILADLQQSVLPELLSRHPGLSYRLAGEQQQQQESLGGLVRSFSLALFLIYALLAVPFRSYWQPFVVMSAIPFGCVGALWGHFLMGRNVTFFSLFGIVALAGVVVNDSLIFVDYVNRCTQGGRSLAEALIEAGRQRFRPIFLTSLTTFVGLVPLLLETSIQAQFLIPLAISLGFGIVFATLIILVLIPTGLAILEDLRRLFTFSFRSASS